MTQTRETINPPATPDDPPAAEAGTAATGSSERSLRVLGAIASGAASSLADLSNLLALPKATVHRLCATLLETGHLARDVDERDYVIGPALQRLALDTLNHGSVRGLRHEVLATLVREVGETCNFTTLDGASVLYLDRVEAPWPWRLTLDVGTHVPLHCTASGKLFLALMPAAQRETVLTHLQLAPLTPNSLVTPAALRAECERIARAGHAIDREEFVAGLVAAAVPVVDGLGRVRAAIAIHAPSSRLSVEQVTTKLPALHAAAARMRGLL